MPNGHASCYVYYRVLAEHVPQARRAVAAMMDELGARTRIVGSLSQRTAPPGEAPDDGAAAPTWMETYVGIDNIVEFSQELDAVVRRHDFEQWLADDAERTTEWFEPLVVAA